MPPPALRTCLYECRVMHHRFSPKVHHFDYRIFLAAIDLDELEAVNALSPLFSVNGRNLYSVREKDYLPTGEPLHNGEPACAGGGGRLKDRVIAFMGARGVDIEGGSVILVTLPGILGYAFNPVSFYFCWDRDGRPAGAIAEVTNTFREMKPYFVPHRASGGCRGRVAKEFYVSPFTDVDVAFDFHLPMPGEALSVQIDDIDGTGRLLTSTLRGHRRAFTTGALALFCLKYPLMSLRVIASIHLHALALWLKRVPWFAKAARPDRQRNLYRPHASLARHPSS